jgi:hypothetical protein
VHANQGHHSTFSTLNKLSEVEKKKNVQIEIKNAERLETNNKQLIHENKDLKDIELQSAK